MAYRNIRKQGKVFTFTRGSFIYELKHVGMINFNSFALNCNNSNCLL